MKRLLKIFAVLAVAAFAFACSDDEDSTSVTDVTIPSQYLTEGFTFSATGGTATMNLVSKGVLDVTSNQSWCSVTFISSTSNGTCSYEITVSENSSTDVRTAEITVSADGKVAGTVKVTQEGADGLLVAQTRYELSAEAQTFTVTVTANGTPEITCNNSWITQESGTKAMESADYVFSVTTNYGSERTGGITFTLGSQTETVTVVQAEGSGGSMASDAKTLISKIYAGVNIGNTMEVPGGETGWGNPRVNKTYVDGLSTMGFNAVRIPCAWDSYIINDATYEIDPTWMERVSEVVGYCLDNDMYVIVNIHWDGGWLEDNIKQGYNESINAKQKALWTQIAD
ncbi:MAG: cellulase family glycosylhydrolase, partial [Bacteroidales bacterium]|nr:cellulase family glycosylhydrolase [Bacteroidales bacterium]